MTITQHDDIWVMRIAGVVDELGDQVTFTTRATAYGTDDVAAIRAIPTVTGATAIPVDTIASDAGLGVDLTATAQVLALLHRGAPDAVADASLGAVRTTGFIARTATSFTVTDATNITVGDWLWFDNELVEVTGKSTNTLTVTRGQGGTTAIAHAYFAPGFILWPSLPQLRGAHVTVSRVSATAVSSASETVVWTGIVDGRSLSGGVLSLSLSSYWQGLSRATYLPPRSLRTQAHRVDASVVWVDGVMLLKVHRPWYISADQYGELNHEYWRVVADDGRWVVIYTGDITTGTATVAGVLGEAYDPTGDGYLIIQAGRGPDELFDVTRIDTAERAAEVLGDGRPWESDGVIVSASWPAVSLEYAWVFDGNDGRQPSAIVGALLKATALPWSMCLGAPAAAIDTDSFVALNDALADADGARSYGLAPAYDRYWIAPYWPDADTRLSDVLEDLLQALGCMLAPSRAGTLRTWAWTGVMVPTATLTGTEHRQVDVTQSSAPAALASVTFERKTYDGTDTWHRISAVAVQLRSGGRHLQHSLRALAGHAQALWDGASLSLLAQYERECTRAVLLLGAEVAVQTGDVLLLDGQWPQIVGADGVLGSSAWRALVTRVGIERSRSSRVEVLLLGTDRGGRWSHSFTVVAPGYSGGKVYVDPETYSTDDLDGFVTGSFVVLLDDELEDKAMTATEVTAVGTDGTGTYLTVALTTAAAGDIITLASYDDTSTSGWAWMADTGGELGAADDPAQRYE